MGKGTIISSDGGGSYTVEIQYDNSRVIARLSAIATDIAKLVDIELPAALQKQLESEQAFYAVVDDLNQYLADVKAGVVDIDPLRVNSFSSEVLKKRTAYELDKRAYDLLVLRHSGLLSEQSRLQSRSHDSEQVTAWCADYTDSLTGDVGLIEIALEKEDRPPIILPGDVNAAGYQAGYDEARDGIVTNFYNQSAHQLYTNRAYLPALAKWKPRYRTGTIDAISGDSCSVSLNPIVSSQQALNVNQSETLVNVPIVYMTCNGAAFEIGDGVVVAFGGNWEAPTVIGFSSSPKPCEINSIFALMVAPSRTGRFIEIDPEQVKPTYTYGALEPFSTTSFYIQFARLFNRMYWVNNPGNGGYFTVAETTLNAGSQNTSTVLSDGPLAADRTIAGIYKTKSGLLVLTESDTSSSPTTAVVRVYDADYNLVTSFFLPSGVTKTVSVAANSDRIVVASRFNIGHNETVWVYDYDGNLITSHLVSDYNGVVQINVSDADDDRFFVFSIDNDSVLSVMHLDELGGKLSDYTMTRANPSDNDSYTGIKADKDAVYLFRNVRFIDFVITYQGHVDRYDRTLTFDESGNVITDSISTTVSHTFDITPISIYHSFALQ